MGLFLLSAIGGHWLKVDDKSMDPRSPRILSAWAEQILLEFLQFNVDLNNKTLSETITNNLMMYGQTQASTIEDFAFKWNTLVFYHPALSQTERNSIKPWDIKVIHPNLEKQWADYYVDWYKPVDDDRPIILGLINAAMNRSYSPEDWKKLLPNQMHSTIDRYIENMQDILGPHLTEKDVENFHNHYARIEQRVKERLAKNLLLKGI